MVFITNLYYFFICFISSFFGNNTSFQPGKYHLQIPDRKIRVDTYLFLTPILKIVYSLLLGRRDAEMDRQSWDGNRNAGAEPLISQGSGVLPPCAGEQAAPERQTSVPVSEASSPASCESGNCSERGEASYDLTVVTACLNAIGCLPRCVRSVQPLLRDSALRVEYLVIDGGSTDGTPEYLEKEVQRGGVTRFVSESDGGLYEAMNKGLCLARGKVVVFIHADDEICPEAASACCAPILSGAAGYVMSSAWVLPLGEEYRGGGV